MVAKAMRDRAPEMYQRLMRDGTLQQVLTDRVRLLMETYSTLAETAKAEQAPNPNVLTQIQATDDARRRAWEAAVATALDFPEGQTTG